VFETRTALHATYPLFIFIFYFFCGSLAIGGHLVPDLHMWLWFDEKAHQQHTETDTHGLIKQQRRKQKNTSFPLFLICISEINGRKKCGHFGWSVLLQTLRHLPFTAQWLLGYTPLQGKGSVSIEE